MNLAAIEEIKQLKYRYFRLLDLRKWAEFRECFTEDATGGYAGLDFANPDDIVAYLSENMGPGLISLHQGHHPEIVVTGETATGTWYLQDQIIVPEFDFFLTGAAFYQDRYRLTDSGWRIVHTGYQRTYEMRGKLGDVTVKSEFLS